MVNVKEVLQKINAVRVACGFDALKDLPKGTHSAHSCPIANALKPLGDVQVTRNEITGVSKQFRSRVGFVLNTETNGAIKNPSEFRYFVSEFDGRNLHREYDLMR